MPRLRVVRSNTARQWPRRCLINRPCMIYPSRRAADQGRVSAGRRGTQHQERAEGRETKPRRQADYCDPLWLPKIASGLAQLPRWATLVVGMIDLLKRLGGLLVEVQIACG